MIYHFIVIALGGRRDLLEQRRLMSLKQVNSQQSYIVTLTRVTVLQSSINSLQTHQIHEGSAGLHHLYRFSDVIGCQCITPLN